MDHKEQRVPRLICDRWVIEMLELLLLQHNLAPPDSYSGVTGLFTLLLTAGPLGYFQFCC